MHTAQFQLHADVDQRHWWFVGRRRIMRRLIDELLCRSPESQPECLTTSATVHDGVPLLRKKQCRPNAPALIALQQQDI